MLRQLSRQRTSGSVETRSGSGLRITAKGRVKNRIRTSVFDRMAVDSLVHVHRVVDVAKRPVDRDNYSDMGNELRNYHQQDLKQSSYLPIGMNTIPKMININTPGLGH